MGCAEAAGGEGDEQDGANGKDGVADANTEACASKDGRFKEGVPGVAERGSGGEGELVRGPPRCAPAENKDKCGDAEFETENDGSGPPSPGLGSDKNGGAGCKGNEEEKPGTGNGLSAAQRSRPDRIE